MGKKQKLMNGIAMVADGLQVAAELLATLRGRTLTARKSAGRAINDLRDDTADVAQRFANDVKNQLHPGPSAGIRVLQFAAGFGVGVGAGLLFAPLPGARMRANLFNAMTDSASASNEMSSNG